MEAFRDLMVSYGAQKEAAKTARDEKRAEDALNEGLSLTHDIICEIEAKCDVKDRKYDSPKNLLCNLRAYRSYSVGNERRNLSYITAELASVVLAKLVENQGMLEKTTVSHDLPVENDPSVCACDHMNYKDHLDELIDILLELKSVNRLQVSCFVSSVIDLRLPVMVLSALHKADLLPVSVYIIHIVNKKDVLHHFIKDLISHLGRSQYNKDRNISQKPCEGSVQLLVPLLHLGLGEEIVEPGHATWQLCNQACRDFVDHFLLEMTDHIQSTEDGSTLGRHFLQLREKKWHVGERAVQEFLLLSLQAIATASFISAEQALSLQYNWLHSECVPSLGTYVQNLLTAMGEEEAQSGIMSMIEEESSKWQSILPFITVNLTNFPGAAATLKTYVDECLARALTKHSRSLLACAFLIARQACLVSTVSSVRNVFPSYGAWFGSSFGVEAGSVQTSTNVAAFSFLMEFLTDLVPTDPPLCLRVHINKVPAAPAHCSHMLADFVSLAKTRLQDLGEATGSGLFAFEYTPEEDVTAALLHFENSGGQISRVLLDSSKFRRAQFERQFLPALLVPEPNCEELTPRQLLITKLQVAGKIPPSMFQQYETACQRLIAQHSGQRKLERISGTPLERWRAVLELFVSTVRENGVNLRGALPEEGESVFGAVGAQLEPLLRWAADQPDAGTIHRKVVGRLLKACELCFEPPTPPGIERSSVWLHRLVTLFRPHPTLLRQFHGAVYRIACDTTRLLHVTEAAAALACVLDLHKEDIPVLKSTVSTNSEKLGEAIGQALQPTSRVRMLHALAFCSSYLRLINEAFADTLPSPWCTPSLLRMLIYLRERLLHSNAQEVLDACACSWNVPSSWSVLVSEVQLSLTEWLDLEAAIDRSEDPLNVRHLYLCEWITQHCDRCPAPELLVASLKYTAKGNAPWGNEILYVIPSIVIPSTSSIRSAETIPWLIETWVDISIQFSHQEIFKAVQNLPPWMLLTNTLGVAPTPLSVSTLADFITKHMDQMSEKGFLSLNVVCTVVGAVRAAAPLCRGEILSQIIDACPPLHLSILRHGQQLQIQLVPSFTASSPMDCSVERIMKMVASAVNPKPALNNPNWEVGLVDWSQGAPLPLVDNGSLFFHLLDLGAKLLIGSVSMVMVSQGPVLPSSVQLATLLVQQPLHCLKMVGAGTKAKPHSLPAAGISCPARAGLSLAVMGAMLSLHNDQLPSSGSDSAKVCCKVLLQSLDLWKEVCRELDLCDPRVQEVSFVQWLARRVRTLEEYFQIE